MDYYRGGIDKIYDNEFDIFSEVLNETDGESRYDFYDAETMADPRTIAICQRLCKYVESSDEDSVFGAEAGLNFAVTLAGLADFRTERALDILSQTIAGYEQQDYTSAQRSIEQVVEAYYQNNQTVAGFMDAYLLTDSDETLDQELPTATFDSVMTASRLSAAVMFMAIEEQAAAADIVDGVDSLLEA